MPSKERIIQKLKHDGRRAATAFKWVVFSLVTGIILGVVGALFYHGIIFVTDFRTEHHPVQLLLPLMSVFILFLYHIFHNDKDGGTNLVLSAIHSDDEIPFRMSFLIFISTLLSHLTGASVGREGAALQIGGSVGNTVGKLFHFNQNDKNTMIMCGMSSVFSALFGTPMAAAIFSMEVVSVGIMHYAALVPCVISAIVSRQVADFLGAPAPSYDLPNMDAFTIESALWIILLSILCGLASILFCLLLHKGEVLFDHLLPNRYVRAFILGFCVLILSFLFPDGRYNGTGIQIIVSAMNGDVYWYDFLLKILFTVLSILAFYKGGEIVPSFFIGATLGAAFGNLTGMDPALCAAVGMGSLFCGVTNCPISSLLICFELFGLEGWPFFILSIAFSYVVSGYYGLYQSQRIVYSKYQSNYIDKQTH